MTKDCPVDILQYAWEFDIVLDLYKRVKPRTVLEIGSLYGGTLYHWLNLGHPDLSLFAIDLFSTVDFEDTVKLWQTWKRNNQMLTAMKINSSSPDAIINVKNEFKSGVDWLFIDGGHAYEEVKSDYQNYFPLVAQNGYCIFHDIFGENGVAKLWNEINIMEYPTIEICHTKWKLGIGIIQKWTQ